MSLFLPSTTRCASLEQKSRITHLFACLMASLEERTATEVHATLCSLVRTNAAKNSAWADYSAVLLGEEAAAFFASRLPDAKAGASDADEADDADAAVICEHCGGAVPQISLRVASLDGITQEVTVAKRELVREVKRLVGQVRRRESWFLSFVAHTHDSHHYRSSVAFRSRATWTRA
jgi:hypothetical protein